MHRISSTIAKAVAVVGLAFGLTAVVPSAAHADTSVTVPGCYGAIYIVCDPTVEVLGTPQAAVVTWTVPVCVGTCRDVDVPWVSITPGTGGERVCYNWKDRQGYQSAYYCTSGSIVGDTITLVNQIVADTLYTVEDRVNRAIYTVCQRIQCETIIAN